MLHSAGWELEVIGLERLKLLVPQQSDLVLTTYQPRSKEIWNPFDLTADYMCLSRIFEPFLLQICNIPEVLRRHTFIFNFNRWRNDPTVLKDT